ncbi:PRD domain-containing protein [Anaeromicrobium sediminis]|uniref:Antiterminator n=1 Tax=Anaeromicrobium sediminis TaxID=1478221 RepID=A0A267MJM8_9FIRM|nr:PRD domain-containing protein [Anaeromicrobium sediminis]PAB59801.1 antiterminator [Anaeromicrobium sediminis]
MEKYTVNKVLSNNVVLAEKDNQNYILVGKGIGFSKKKGHLLENPRIDEKFISLKGLDEDEKENFINQIDPKVIELVKEIVEMVKKDLGEELNPNTYLGFADHINFAIQRLKEGIEIVNPFLTETKFLYPEEYSLAEKAVMILSHGLDISIPEAEIGFLALHIYGGRGEKNKMEALEKSKLMRDILDFVEKTLRVNLDRNSFICQRFILHLKGVISRVNENKNIENILMSKLKFELRKEIAVATEIGKIIENTLKCHVSQGEIGYIALHLHKLRGMKNL